jgi:hypothetical protein
VKAKLIFYCLEVTIDCARTYFYYEVICLGEVYRPEDVVGKKKKPSDLYPTPHEIIPTTLQDLIREIRLLKAEINNKIKQVLRANNIAIQ